MATTPRLQGAPPTGSIRRIKASDWEKYGEGLSLQQEEALAAVRRALVNDDPTAMSKATTTGRPESARAELVPSSSTDEPAATVKRGRAGMATEASSEAVATTESIDPSALHSKTEFYQWFSDVEATRASEVEAKYKRHAEAVEKQIEVCNELLGDIGSVLDIFSELKLSQRAISGRTDALKEQCDRLVSDREKLMSVTGLIKERLDHFDRLDELSLLFHAPVSASSDPQAILKGLEDLETSLKFTSKHPEYLESAKYHAKFQNLQTRAMALVKSYFQESMTASIAECKASAMDDGANTGVDEQSGPADCVNMTIQNVKFRAVAEPRLQELMAGVCRHSDRETYKNLIKDCSGVYCKARFEILRYGVLDAMQKLKLTSDTPESETTDAADAADTAEDETSKVSSSPAPVGILTGGAEIISRTAEEEIHLYRNIFPGSSHEQAMSMLSTLFDSMCILLAAVIEPVIYSSLNGDVHGLCQMSARLMELTHHETLGTVFNVPSLCKLGQAIEQMILRQAKSDWKKGLAESTTLGSGANILLTLLEPEDAEFLEGLRSPLDVTACQSRRNPKPFDPVARGIRMMTAVQASVSGRSAMVLVREVVSDLLDVIHRASPDPSDSSEAYGAIFALRQLCLLSECLDVLRVAELDSGSDDRGGGTDGNGTADNLTGGGKKRGFVSSLSSRIPLLSSFSSLTSRSSQGGAGMSGADLVTMLKKKTDVARDFCILTCAQDATNPLLSFLTKVTAAKVSGREQIKSHAFATLERVKELATDVRAAIEGPVLKHIALLHMVLAESELRIVLEAIRVNLEDALTQMQDIVKTEYTAEEAQDIGRISYEHLLTH